MIGTIIFGAIFIGLGLYILYDVKKGGLKDATTRKTKMMIKILGIKGASIFYSILGGIVVLCGIGMIAGAFFK